MSVLTIVLVIAVGTAGLAALIVRADLDLAVIAAFQEFTRRSSRPRPVPVLWEPVTPEPTSVRADLVPRPNWPQPDHQTEGERWLAAMASYGSGGGPVPETGPERPIGPGASRRGHGASPTNLPGRWVMLDRGPQEAAS